MNPSRPLMPASLHLHGLKFALVAKMDFLQYESVSGKLLLMGQCNLHSPSTCGSVWINTEEMAFLLLVTSALSLSQISW